MKKLTTGFLIGFMGLLSTAEASNLRHHPNHLFVKMKQGETLVKSPLIKSAKKLLGIYT